MARMIGKIVLKSIAKLSRLFAEQTKEKLWRKSTMPRIFARRACAAVPVAGGKHFIATAPSSAAIDCDPPAASRSEVKSRGVMREGRACRGRTRAGLVQTPRAEAPPPLYLRFQYVIKLRPLPEPSSPKASTPRQANMVGHKVYKAFAAVAFFVARNAMFCCRIDRLIN